jgi:hypothetical protein
MHRRRVLARAQRGGAAKAIVLLMRSAAVAARPAAAAASAGSAGLAWGAACPECGVGAARILIAGACRGGPAAAVTAGQGATDGITVSPMAGSGRPIVRGFAQRDAP